MQSRQIEVFKLLWYPAAQTIVAQPQMGQAVHVAQFHRYAASQVIVVEVQQTQVVVPNDQGGTTLWNKEIRRRTDVVASSLTGQPCVAWLAPSWLSSTTNGPSAVDISPPPF